MKEIKVSNDSHSELLLNTISIDDAVGRTMQSDGKAIIMVVIKDYPHCGQHDFDWIAQITSDENGRAYLIEECFYVNANNFHGRYFRTVQEEIIYLAQNYPRSEFYLVENWRDMADLLTLKLGTRPSHDN